MSQIILPSQDLLTTGTEPPDFDPQAAALQELAQRELCRRRLLPYIMRVNPAYDPGWIHRLICKELEDFERKVVECTQTKKPGPRLMLFMPPRHGKSEIASRCFPPWVLGRNPKFEIISASYAASLALKFSRAARNVVHSPLHSSIFPNAKPDNDAKGLENWMMEAGGGYMAAGVGGPLTGNGMHIGIIDDPVKNREEAESQTVREAVVDWYTSTFYTRLAPGGGILLIMTRWHESDLAGYLMKEMQVGGDEWRILKFPAIAEQDDEFRKKGDPLHGSRYPIETLRKIQHAVGARDWSALYQQNPTVQEGNLFTRNMFKYYRDAELPARGQMTFYQAWDLAVAKNQTNDYSVCVTVGVDRNDTMYVVDVMRERLDTYELVEKMIDLYELWQPDRIGIEEGVIKHAIGPHLNKRIEERRAFGFPIEALKPGKQDKVARSNSIRGRMRLGKVFFNETADYLQTLRNELLGFPNAAHDDQVDALSYLGMMLQLFSAPEVQSEDKTPKWMERLSQHSKDSGHFMSA